MINKFRGRDYFFLSNMCQRKGVIIPYNGVNYMSVEIAYQAAKCKFDSDRDKFKNSKRSDIVKRMSRRIVPRDDWDDVKLGIMDELVRIKFQNQKLKEQLLNTGDEELVEGNDWHDNYWGSCSCDECKDVEKQNHLGKLLMRIRSELRGDNVSSQVA